MKASQVMVDQRGIAMGRKSVSGGVMRARPARIQFEVTPIATRLGN
jgi:hypothetical protein